MIMGIQKIDQDFWSGKKVFITGNTGFKGSWLTLWLHHLGAIVKGYSINIPTSPSMFSICELNNICETEFSEIKNFEKLNHEINTFKPDIVIHMAAQSLVRKSYAEPMDTFSTNVIGTVNLLEACRFCSSIDLILNITSDKCYENNEWHWGYRENDRLGGRDPYSNSKACAELVTQSYRDSFFDASSNIALLSARAGNVIGGGDWAADRLVPDALRASDARKEFILRNPKSIRPWQHILDLLSGYLQLIQTAYGTDKEFNGAWNFGPNEENIESVENIIHILQKKMSFKWVTMESIKPTLHEAQLLKLDSSKVRNEIGWQPILSLDETIELIADWHNSYTNGKNMYAVTLSQIKNYTSSINIQKHIQL